MSNLLPFVGRMWCGAEVVAVTHSSLRNTDKFGFEYKSFEELCQIYSLDAIEEHHVCNSMVSSEGGNLQHVVCLTRRMSRWRDLICNHYHQVTVSCSVNGQ